MLGVLDFQGRCSRLTALQMPMPVTWDTRGTQWGSSRAQDGERVTIPPHYRELRERGNALGVSSTSSNSGNRESEEPLPVKSPFDQCHRDFALRPHLLFEAVRTVLLLRSAVSTFAVE